ncbi:hypothetical protein IFR05_002937 [Cadophora sp. M221]|nr:hypothetical protein IFR05_002937 [Cadophora sp. M221]
MTTLGALRSTTSDLPLIAHTFTADPSAHVFDGKLYIYPSHDRETNTVNSIHGGRYDMNDYHVFSLESINGPVIDHGVALRLDDIPWASKQLWAPDAATKNGKYYFYFPARDKEVIFRIGVGTSHIPQGPFTAEPEPIAGSYSIDPASFIDEDGRAYLYFGGIQGGQLQCWSSGKFDGNASIKSANTSALMPRVARLSEDMLSFSSDALPLAILDVNDQPLQADDHDRRFFEGAWMHKYNGLYYFSYSTGDTHFIVYATGRSPLGPFKYRGRILEPVVGWTTHHSIVKFKGRWGTGFHQVENTECFSSKDCGFRYDFVSTKLEQATRTLVSDVRFETFVSQFLLMTFKDLQGRGLRSSDSEGFW